MWSFFCSEGLFPRSKGLTTFSEMCIYLASTLVLCTRGIPVSCMVVNDFGKANFPFLQKTPRVRCGHRH